MTASHFYVQEAPAVDASCRTRCAGFVATFAVIHIVILIICDFVPLVGKRPPSAAAG